MKKQNLVFGIISILATSFVLVGCGNQKSASANVNDLPQATKVDRNHRLENSADVNRRHQERRTNDQVESGHYRGRGHHQGIATQRETRDGHHAQMNNYCGNGESRHNQASQVDTDTLGLDFTTQQQLVNVGMGYIAQKEGQSAMPDGYWNFAKSNWGISDAQVLVKIGGNTFQIFSQGAEQYALTINGQNAVVTARSNYTQTTKSVTINISSLQIVDSTF